MRSANCGALTRSFCRSWRLQPYTDRASSTRTLAMSSGNKEMFGSSTSRIAQQLIKDYSGAPPTLVHPLPKDTDPNSFPNKSAAAWARVNNFKAKAGEVLAVPDASGALACVLLGLGDAKGAEQIWAYAALPGKLPSGTYALASGPEIDHDQALLGWILGCYKFGRYKTGKLDSSDNNSTSKPPAAATGAEDDADAKTPDTGDTPASAATGASGSDAKPMLIMPKEAKVAAVVPLAEAFYWARDMINTPAEDLGPSHLKAEAAALAKTHPGAKLSVIEGDELLAANYPAIHTVGRAAARPPLLLDLSWNPTKNSSSTEPLPLVALVGKGVCFDSGGLDIKTAQGMRLMKKDMGGAALVLSLAHVIMSAQLPIQLRVLVPAVENAISGSAYRPGDVLQTRAGITVENGNTDAEGRLILCDAIWEAANNSGRTPDVLIDAATLTGAARVALGPELPAVFSNDDTIWKHLEAAAKAESDPLWRLPLWQGYRKMLDSKVADIGSTGEAGSAGSITAALFLQEFAKAAPSWVHIDTAGWVSGGSTGAGKPEGGEALALRALWRFLQDRYQQDSNGAGDSASA